MDVRLQSSRFNVETAERLSAGAREVATAASCTLTGEPESSRCRIPPLAAPFVASVPVACSASSSRLSVAFGERETVPLPPSLTTGYDARMSPRRSSVAQCRRSGARPSSDGRPQRMGGGVVDESNAFCIVYDWERPSLTSGRATWSSTAGWSSQPALRKELKFWLKAAR